jgi:hypothetical protein
VQLAFIVNQLAIELPIGISDLSLEYVL